jgi:hypothetical protein
VDSRRLRLLDCIKALLAWSRSSLGFWIRLWYSRAATMVRLLRSWMVLSCARPKKAVRLFVLDFQVVNFCYSLFCLAQRKMGPDGDPQRGWGFFRQKTLSCFLISHFIFDGAGKESLLQVASFSMAFSWACLFLFFLTSAAAVFFRPSYHQNCSLYSSCREGKIKRKKGDHKTSFGYWVLRLEDFQQIRERDAAFSISSLLLPFSLGRPFISPT